MRRYVPRGSSAAVFRTRSSCLSWRVRGRRGRRGFKGAEGSTEGVGLPGTTSGEVGGPTASAGAPAAPSDGAVWVWGTAGVSSGSVRDDPSCNLFCGARSVVPRIPRGRARSRRIPVATGTRRSLITRDPPLPSGCIPQLPRAYLPLRIPSAHPFAGCSGQRIPWSSPAAGHLHRGSR